MYWDDYYKELDPVKRKNIYEKLKAEVSDDGMNEFREYLYDVRYKDSKNEEHQIDTYIACFLNNIFLNKDSLFLHKKYKKDILKSLDQMGINKAKEIGDKAEEAIYREIRNAAARYFESYGGRKLFGMMEATEEDTIKQTCLYAWKMSVGVALQYDLQEEMDILIRAVHDEYITLDDDADLRFTEMDEYMRNSR